MKLDSVFVSTFPSVQLHWVCAQVQYYLIIFLLQLQKNRKPCIAQKYRGQHLTMQYNSVHDMQSLLENCAAAF